MFRILTVKLLMALLGVAAANPLAGSHACTPGPLSLFPTPGTPFDTSSPAANTTCPVGEPVRPGWPTARAAVCPFTYETDHDPDRFPATVTRAVCRCPDHCLLDPTTAQPRTDFACTPVAYNLPVLRRGPCLGGVYRVEESVESVTVACVCLRRESGSRRAPGILG